MTVAIGDRRAENLARHLRLPGQRADGRDAVQALVLPGDDDHLVGRDEGRGADDSHVALIGRMVPLVRAAIAAEIDGEQVAEFRTDIQHAVGNDGRRVELLPGAEEGRLLDPPLVIDPRQSALSAN